MCTRVGKQQTHLAKQNCNVQKVQKQRYTELEQHDSMQDAHMQDAHMQDAHMSCTKGARQHRASIKPTSLSWP